MLSIYEGGAYPKEVKCFPLNASLNVEEVQFPSENLPFIFYKLAYSQVFPISFQIAHLLNIQLD